MPSQTFENLSIEKKDLIKKSLIREFEKKPLYNATVKSIVEDLKISRGSFYQYFASLTDSYFYILKSELIETHHLFIELYFSCDKNLSTTLNEYGKSIAKEIYHKNNYQLYKNRFLYWNPDLEGQWKEYLNNSRENIMDDFDKNKLEELNFIKAIIHNLIQRLFIESWDEKTFLKHYKKHINWIKGGIGHDETN